MFLIAGCVEGIRRALRSIGNKVHAFLTPKVARARAHGFPSLPPPLPVGASISGECVCSLSDGGGMHSLVKTRVCLMIGDIKRDLSIYYRGGIVVMDVFWHRLCVSMI